MAENQDKQDDLALIFDRECPVCTAYSCSVGVDEGQAAGVNRVNARDADHELVRQAREAGLEQEAQSLLAAGRNDVWDVLSRRFESRLILTALANTRGRRIEAAQKLSIGRNTITRKIQKLGLE